MQKKSSCARKIHPRTATPNRNKKSATTKRFRFVFDSIRLFFFGSLLNRSRSRFVSLSLALACFQYISPFKLFLFSLRLHACVCVCVRGYKCGLDTSMKLNVFFIVLFLWSKRKHKKKNSERTMRKCNLIFCSNFLFLKCLFFCFVFHNRK